MPDDEQDGEDGLSMEDQVAALVRAAQSDPENLSERTREEMEKAEAEKREEEVVHSVELLVSVAKPIKSSGKGKGRHMASCSQGRLDSNG